MKNLMSQRSRSLRTLVIATALALVSLPALATASSTEATAEVPVAELMADVSKTLNNYRYDDVFDWIEARVDERTVTLTGSVYQPWKRESLVKRMSAIPGVEQVNDQIEVLPVSAFDDRIRYQVARSIYGSHNFFDRAGWISPPIHIIVDKGRITLEGVVRNEAERMLARSLASRAQSIGKIENNLLIASEIAR